MLTVWWSKTPAPGNFGDVLTPWILRHYGIEHRWETRKAAQAISTGSIIRQARAGQAVLGSGAMWAGDRPNPAARYLWVRGPITARLVREAGGQCPDVYGDPAMLLPRLFPLEHNPVRDVGLFPHYADLPHCSGDVINPLQSVPDVICAVLSCRRIVSSSLHGIIAAHAFGLPAAWVKLGDRLDGDDTKFHDHARSVGLDSMPLSTIDKPVFTVAKYDDYAIHEIMRGFADECLRASIGR